MFASRSLVLLGLCAAAFLLTAGPAAPAADEHGKVKGVVTLMGKPLAKGRILFHLDDDQIVGARIKNGAFVVNRVPAGKWRVSVEGEGVPVKYALDETTPLKVEVTKGEVQLDFAIK